MITTSSLARIDGWIRQDENRAGFLLAGLTLSYALFWSAATSARHYYFHSGYDLAVQHQVIWNTSQGRLLAQSLEVPNDLGDHVRPYLGILSLIYLIAPSPYILLVFQSFVLGLTAWPIYMLVKRKFDSPAVGLSIAFCALAYPPIGFINRAVFSC